jgi:3-mercaptopyruvate sulfurtransferase SseA
LMGKDNVSVYDGSLTEWNSSANRPIKLGSDP